MKKANLAEIRVENFRGEESTRGRGCGRVKDDGVADVKISKGGDTEGKDEGGGEVSYVDETRYTGMKTGNED